MTIFRTLTRAALGTALAAGLLVAAPTAALASPPDHWSVDVDVEYEVEDFAGCGVSVHVQEVGRIEVIDHFDRDGQLDRRQARFQLNITLANEFGTLTQVYRYHDVYDLGTDTGRSQGVNVGLGERGRLEIAAGRLVYDLSTGEVISYTGIDTFADGDDAATCAAVTG